MAAPLKESVDTHESKTSSIEEKQTLVVFDFDWSLINENSDYFPIQKLLGDDYKRIYGGFREKRQEIDSEMIFTRFMDEIVWRYIFHDLGTSKDDFDRVLGTIPVFDENLGIVRALHEHGPTEQFIVSGANTHLIDVILKSNNLSKIFPEERVFTNHSWWEESEKGARLRVKGYQSHVQGDGTSHGCATCVAETYMCKGQIIDDIMKSLTKKVDRIVYIGDGSNDFCPCTRLRDKRDWAFVRRGKSLEGLIDGDSQMKLDERKMSQSVNIRKWDDGKELLAHFIEVFGANLFKSISSEE